MTDPLLSLSDVCVGYGSKLVVRDVSFDIFAGELCALLGQNGSGKTTLLKGICGLLPLRTGRCLAGGLDCTRLGEKDRARHISYIPQRHSKLIGVTVLDAVLMGLNAKLGLFELPAASDKASALQSLEKMEIPHLAYEDFSKLSEGQKQLVILSRTLVQNAPVMLMDEPDSALDYTNKHGTMQKIRNLITSEGKAGLITLHDPNTALAYCDRLILLHAGNIVSEIRLSQASKADVQQCLATIYGNITLIENNGKYIVVNT